MIQDGNGNVPQDGNVTQPPVKGKGKPQKKTASGPAPTGFVDVLRKLSSGLQIITRPQKSFYLVDLHGFVGLAFAFDDYLHGLSRRQPGWKHRGYYAGMMVFCWAAKLQRVAIAAGTCAFDQSELLRVSELQIPSIMALLIDQYGSKVDSHGVEISPYITLDVIRVLLSLATVMMDNQHVAHAPSLVMANYRSSYEMLYGPLIQCFLCLTHISGTLEQAVKNRPNTFAGFNMSMLDVINTQAHLVGAPFLTQNNALAVAPANGQAGICANWFLLAGAPPGVVAHANNNLNNAVISSRLFFCGPAAPLAAANYLPAIRGSIEIPGGYMTYSGELVEMATRMEVRLTSVAPSGSFAPLVTCDPLEDYASGSSVVQGLTTTEYVLGFMLGSVAYWCTDRGALFNNETRERRTEGFSTELVDHTVTSLRATAFHQSLKQKR